MDLDLFGRFNVPRRFARSGDGVNPNFHPANGAVQAAPEAFNGIQAMMTHPGLRGAMIQPGVFMDPRMCGSEMRGPPVTRFADGFYPGEDEYDVDIIEENTQRRRRRRRRERRALRRWERDVRMDSYTEPMQGMGLVMPQQDGYGWNSYGDEGFFMHIIAYVVPARFRRDRREEMW